MPLSTIDSLGPAGNVTVSAAGIVTHSTNPSFWYTLSADQTSYPSDSGSTTTVKFNQLIANVGNAYNPTTGLFTAPATGTYAFYVGILCSANFDQVWSIINGSRVNSFVVGVNATNQSGSCIQRLNLGDTFGVKVYSGTTPTTVTITSNSLHTFFSGCLIG
jgi:hypothetical protein